MSDVTTRDVLLKAAEILEPDGAWIQDTYARTDSGAECDPASQRASCWCATGAICKAEYELHFDSYEIVGPDACMALSAVIGNGIDIEHWNDAPERTQSEVVSALRAAAEVAP